MLLLTAGLPEFAAVPGMPQAPHGTGPGLHGQDTARRSPKQDLLSDPALNTFTDGEFTALPCDLV